METTAVASAEQPASFDARAAARKCARNVGLMALAGMAVVVAFGWIATNWSWLWPSTLRVLSWGGQFWGAAVTLALSSLPCAWAGCVYASMPDYASLSQPERGQVKKATDDAELRYVLMSFATLPLLVVMTLALNSTYDGFSDLSAYGKIAAVLCYASIIPSFVGSLSAILSTIAHMES